MGSNQKKFHLKDKEFLRISAFLQHANKLFNSSNFIKNLDTLEIIIFIYKVNHLENKNINFKALKEYTNKSDMYFGTFIIKLRIFRVFKEKY